MAPTITSEKITLSYPVFAADFIGGNRLLVAGGGGEGRSGVGNKITLLDVSESTTKQSDTETAIQTLSEIELSRNEDACMSLAVVRQDVPTTTTTTTTATATAISDETATPSKSRKKKRKSMANVPTVSTTTSTTSTLVVAGVNSAEKDQLDGKNEHFRIFSVSADSDSNITPISQKQLFSTSKEAETYQRVLRTRGGLTAFASGGGTSSELVVLQDNSKERLRLKTSTEIADLDISYTGKLAYCTDKEIFVTSFSEPPQKLSYTATNGTLRSLRWISGSHLAIILNLKSGTTRIGAEILILEVTTSSIITQRKLHNGIKAATSLDIAELKLQTALAVAGADQSVEILTFEDGSLRTMKTIRDVHPFQISKITFSPPPPPTDISSETFEVLRLATTSIGNTVVVFTLPLKKEGKNGWRLLHPYSVAKQTFISVIISLIAVVVFAAILQVVFVKRAGLDLEQIAEPVWENFKDLAGVGAGKVQEAVKAVGKDPLLNGMEVGVESNPFGTEQEERSVVVEEIGAQHTTHPDSGSGDARKEEVVVEVVEEEKGAGQGHGDKDDL